LRERERRTERGAGAENLLLRGPARARTHLDEGLDLVEDDGHIAELHQRLGLREGERAEARPEAADEDEGLERHLALSECSRSSGDGSGALTLHSEGPNGCKVAAEESGWRARG
jgi:hypothetical protein